MAFEGQDDFVIAKLLVSEGSEVAVGSPIMVTVESEDAVTAFANFELSATESKPISASSTPASSSAVTVAATAIPTDKIRVSPAARYMIDSNSYNKQSIQATGKGGYIITKEDVLQAIKSGTIRTESKIPSVSSLITGPVAAIPTAVVAAASPSQQQPPRGQIPPLIVNSQPINSKFTDIPNTNMRKIIAKRLTESKAQVPHFYTSMECEIDAILKLRKTLKTDLGVNVSVNDLILKASACALRDLPHINSKWNVKSNAILTEGNENAAISVAVATPSGLITPIVQNAQKLGLMEINSKVKDLAGRAKDNKLKPEEFQGGSFSVSNLGELATVFDCYGVMRQNIHDV